MRQITLFEVEQVSNPDDEQLSEAKRLWRIAEHDAFTDRCLFRFYRLRLPTILASGDRTRIVLVMEWLMKHKYTNFYAVYPLFALRQIIYHWEQLQAWLWRDIPPEGAYAELIQSQIDQITELLNQPEERENNGRPDD